MSQAAASTPSATVMRLGCASAVPISNAMYTAINSSGTAG